MHYPKTLTSGFSTFNITLSNGTNDVREIYPDPNDDQSSWSSRHKTYNQMLHYYANTTFDSVADWLMYKKKYSLYKFTRSIFNPVTRIVDFYADHVYSGVLDANPDLPNGIQSAIPLHHDIDLGVREAIAETWNMSNWGVGQSVMVTWGGIAGNCLVEVVDNLMDGSVQYVPVWAGHITDLHLTKSGMVLGYRLEYMTSDERTGERYHFKKEVDSFGITTYRNNQVVVHLENPYPFVPAVWVKHLDLGGTFGIPAVRSSVGKFDELNSIISHTSDHIHKQINSPRVLWSNGKIGSLFNQNDANNVIENEFDTRNDLLMLKGQQGGSTETLVGNLDPATIIPLVDRILTEIERDYPEITMYERLREQNIVTSVGARAQMGDVAKRLSRPSANYDRASVELFKMGVAIAGWRVNSGDWSGVSVDIQNKFKKFNLSSYNDGTLAGVRIMPRPLIHPTTREVAEELQLRTQAVSSVSHDLPIEEKLELLGFRPEQIPSMVKRLKAENEERTKNESREKGQRATPAGTAKNPNNGDANPSNS